MPDNVLPREGTLTLMAALLKRLETHAWFNGRPLAEREMGALAMRGWLCLEREIPNRRREYKSLDEQVKLFISRTRKGAQDKYFLIQHCLYSHKPEPGSFAINREFLFIAERGLTTERLIPFAMKRNVVVDGTAAVFTLDGTLAPEEEDRLIDMSCDLAQFSEGRVYEAVEIATAALKGTWLKS